jgi:hypothetical protein
MNKRDLFDNKYTIKDKHLIITDIIKLILYILSCVLSLFAILYLMLTPLAHKEIPLVSMPNILLILTFGIFTFTIAYNKVININLSALILMLGVEFYLIGAYGNITFFNFILGNF